MLCVLVLVVFGGVYRYNFFLRVGGGEKSQGGRKGGGGGGGGGGVVVVLIVVAWPVVGVLEVVHGG